MLQVVTLLYDIQFSLNITLYFLIENYMIISQNINISKVYDLNSNRVLQEQKIVLHFQYKTKVHLMKYEIYP